MASLILYPRSSRVSPRHSANRIAPTSREVLRMSTRPNILIFMTDQEQAEWCRPDHPCITPNADRLAAEGVRFTQTYTPTAHCCPSRATFMTGLYPSRHGVYNNVCNEAAIHTGLNAGVATFSRAIARGGLQPDAVRQVACVGGGRAGGPRLEGARGDGGGGHAPRALDRAVAHGAHDAGRRGAAAWCVSTTGLGRFRRVQDAAGRRAEGLRGAARLSGGAGGGGRAWAC